MATDHVAVESERLETPTSPRKTPAEARGGGGWGRVILALVILAGLGAGGFYLANREGAGERSSGPATAGGHGSSASHDEHGAGGGDAGTPRVEVVRPRRGGMEMATNQPGTVHAFEFAQMFAKISGYVSKLLVDRGSRVKKDDLLVELYVPEVVAAVEQARAALVRANASVDQAKARVEVAKQKIEASKAYEQEANAKFQAATAQRTYRSKQYQRIKELVERGSVERRLEDEELDRYETAQADEIAARAGVDTARARLAEARADLIQAQADLEGAQADVKVSKANLDKEQALESYTHIRSPYDGVVIFRGEGVHIGAFIQSAAQGQGEPIVTVARDDVMRTVIPVPDTDVPYCDIGDPAIVRVDALRGREFKGTVSRIAESEDVNDRTMRVEVDLSNPLVARGSLTRVLRDGMYGRTEIILEKATKNLTVPSSAIIDRDHEGKGTVEVVRDGKVYRQAVVIGRDTGTVAEIISGLDPDAEVVVQPDLSIADGSPVRAESGAVAEAPKAASAEPS